MTHLHADHVGWNTREEGGRWQPTFPNGRCIFSRIEDRYNASLSGFAIAPDLPPAALGRPDSTPAPGAYEQSVRPVIEAGLAELIAVDGSEVLEGLSFHPTPGHSIDHASIRLRSRGEEAWFLGDVLHHPLQVCRPELRSMYCEFPNPARTSRLWALEHVAETGATCFTSHFLDSSVGRVSRRGDRFARRFS